MANFFSLQDGNLNDISTYGYSLTGLEITNNTTSTMLLTSSLRSASFTSNGSILSALALNISNRSTNPTGTLGLTIQREINFKKFIDSSTNNLSLTTFGSLYQDKFTPFSPNGWSAYFNGTISCYVELPTSTQYTINGSAFTVECWVFPNVNTSGIIVQNYTSSGGIANDGWSLRLQNLGGTVINGVSNNTQAIGLLPSVVPIGRWTHIAACWNAAGTCSVYINGVSAKAIANFNSTVNNERLWIGAQREGTTITIPYNGFISNLRIIRGTELYTANFTPPTAPLTNITNTTLLTFQDNRLRDNSTNNVAVASNGTTAILVKDTSPFAITEINPSVHGGSGFFDGTDDGLFVPKIPLGTNDFTVECWVYPTNSAAQPMIVGQWSGTVGGTTLSWALMLSNDANRFLRFVTSTNGSAIARDMVSNTAGTALPLNAWSHVAVSKTTGGVYRFFINGVLRTTLTFPDADSLFDATNPITIGRASDNKQLFTGYISNVRVVNGTALYNTNFTPSATPLTNVPNTALLLNTNNLYKEIETVSETYPINGFTGYDGSNNFLSPHSQNWQILKLTNPLSSISGETISYSLSTSNPNQLSLMGKINPVDITRISTINLNGSPSLTSFKPYPNFENSYFLDGNDDYFTVPQSLRFAFSGDFTIEFWINTSTFAQDTQFRRIFSFGANNSNNLQLAWIGGTTNIVNVFSNVDIIGGTLPVADGNWHHVAVSRYNNIMRLYVDGVQSGNATYSVTNYNAGTSNLLSIGTYNNTQSGRLSGYINEFRIVNGTAVYTTPAFTPPTTPLTNVPNTVFLMKNGVRYNQALISEVPVNTLPYAVVRGDALLESTIKPFVSFNNSLRFNSATTVDYLEVPNGPHFNFNGDFTIECWVNTSVFNVDGNSRRIFSFARSTAPNNLSLAFWTTTTTPAQASTNLGLWTGSLIGIGTRAVADGNWHHVALSRANGVMKLFVDGNQSFSINNTTIYDAGATTPLFIGAATITNSRLNGYINEFRIINGVGLYTSNFTPPTQPLENILGTVFLLKTGAFNALKVIPQTTYISTDDSLHLCSSLTNLGTESRSISAVTSNYPNLYVHNKATLKFPLSTDIHINGSNGLQITSDGELQIGTSLNPVPSNITHQLNLLDNNIDVHNGGKLNVYGAYKVPYTKLTTPSLSTARTFTATDAVSSNWKVNDTVVFTPNTTVSTSYDTLTLSSFDSDSTFRTTTSARFAHSVIDYVPNVANMTRNVKIRGTEPYKGSIRAIDNAVVNINNVEFNNINSNLVVGVSGNGSFSLSGCTLSGSGIESLLSVPSKKQINTSLYNNVLFRTQYALSSIDTSINNSTISNNLFLSSRDAGVYIKNLSSSSSVVNNNIIVGPSRFGTYLEGNVSNTTIDSFVNYNNTTGLYISGNNIGKISNIINTYNTVDGVYVNALSSNLSDLSFENIICINNKSDGFTVSGNNLNPLTPVSLNINGLTANNNSAHGIEAYNITGNLSVLTLNDNISGGIRTSIGNGLTIFDGLTSILSSTPMNILSGHNYSPFIIRNTLLSSNSSAGIRLDSCIFSKFSLENSTVSSSTPIQINTTRNLLEGSYLINNSILGSTPLGTGLANKYQSYATRATGFAFTNLNKIPNYHVTFYSHGERAIDNSIANNILEYPSERLTPYSNTIKIRSGSKFVALDAGDNTIVRVNVRKSISTGGETPYNGNPPRLILKANPAMGIYRDTVLDELTDINNINGSFVRLTGITEAVSNNGVLEFYIDCDGTQGWINIDNWGVN
jgi:hypothetical protein